MKHKQILDKLAAAGLVDALDLDVREAVFKARCEQKHRNLSVQAMQDLILDLLMPRWNCVFAASAERVAPLYRDKASLAFATLLHQHGFATTHWQEAACAAIDRLNAAVALGDAFYRQSEGMKALLGSDALLPARNPAQRQTVCTLRGGDLLSVQLHGRFYGCHVHDADARHADIEFFEGEFPQPPEPEQLSGLAALGCRYNDGVLYRQHYVLHSLPPQHDPAGQFILLGSGQAPRLDGSLAEPAFGGAVVSPLELCGSLERQLAHQ